MNVARLSMSHVTLREHTHYIQTIRKLSHRPAISVATPIDLPGPNYCTGKLRHGEMGLTLSSSTAERVSKYRPRMPMIAMTHDGGVAGRLMLRWESYPFRIDRASSMDELFGTEADKLLKVEKIQQSWHYGLRVLRAQERCSSPLKIANSSYCGDPKNTIARGGKVMVKEWERPWQGIGAASTPPKLP